MIWLNLTRFGRTKAQNGANCASVSQGWPLPLAARGLLHVRSNHKEWA